MLTAGSLQVTAPLLVRYTLSSINSLLSTKQKAPLIEINGALSKTICLPD